jgi:hypothetical protein
MKKLGSNRSAIVRERQPISALLAGEKLAPWLE